MILRGVALAVLLGSAAFAEAPESSPVPPPRPQSEEAAPPQDRATSLRPVPRPLDLRIQPQTMAAIVRPRPGTDLVTPRRGQLCGTRGIEGEQIAPVTSRVNGCGIADPVRVRSIAGVRLSQPATVDCSVARALNTWVGDVLQSAFDGQIRTLQIAGSYTCRGRNNRPTAKISEHGKGRAIDISGLTFRDGQTITVLNDWNKGQRGRTMVAAYKAGCGIFGTTLGPGSDGYHEDHMHLDTPSDRRSAYCR